MKVLLTGANGLIGSRIVSILVQQPGVQVLATGKGVCRLNQTQDLQYFSCDLTNEEEVQDVFNSCKPNTVIHCAAISHVDQCEQNPTECWEVNVKATEFLLKAAAKFKSHFIYFSSDFVFEGVKRVYNEEDSREPVNYYGQSKVAAENLVKAYPNSKTIIRTILVYGVSESISRSNLILWVKKSLENKKPIRVAKDQFRMATWVDDLALAACKIACNKKEGVFHVSGSEYLSVYEMAVKIGDFYDLNTDLIEPVLTSELSEHTPRPLSTGFDLEKTEELLERKTLSFEEGLKHFEKQFSALNL